MINNTISFDNLRNLILIMENKNKITVRKNMPIQFWVFYFLFVLIWGPDLAVLAPSMC